MRIYSIVNDDIFLIEILIFTLTKYRRILSFFEDYNTIKKDISKLATEVADDQNAPFSIAITSRCRGGRYSFPWIAPLYSLYVPYIAEC